MKEPPIQNLDSFDVVGERKDGGVDLVVVCSGPLDNSEEIQSLLREKVESYLAAAVHPNLPNIYPAAKNGPVRIILVCPHEVAPKTQQTIDELTRRGATMGVAISLRSSAV